MKKEFAQQVQGKRSAAQSYRNIHSGSSPPCSSVRLHMSGGILAEGSFYCTVPRQATLILLDDVHIEPLPRLLPRIRAFL